MAEKPIIIAATRWVSATFSGMRIDVAGWTPKPGTEDGIELPIAGMLTADVRASDDGSGASILLVAERDDPQPELPSVLTQLLLAIETANG